MTRLDRIIEVFKDYDDLVEELSLRNGDNSQRNALKDIRARAAILIYELENHGCRRKNLSQTASSNFEFVKACLDNGILPPLNSQIK